MVYKLPHAIPNRNNESDVKIVNIVQKREKQYIV